MKQIYTYYHGCLDVVKETTLDNYRIITAQDENKNIYNGITNERYLEILLISPNIKNIILLERNELQIDKDCFVEKDDGYIYHYKLVHNNMGMSSTKFKNFKKCLNNLYIISNDENKEALYNVDECRVITPYFKNINVNANNIQFYDWIKCNNDHILIQGNIDNNGKIKITKIYDTISGINNNIKISSSEKYNLLLKKLSYKLSLEVLNKLVKNNVKQKTK